MPAKGQDMPTVASPRISLFLARLLGPIFVAIAVGVLVNGAVFRAIAEEGLRSHALIYLTGLFAITAGVAILLNHNVWVADWRVLITIFGWLAAHRRRPAHHLAARDGGSHPLVPRPPDEPDRRRPHLAGDRGAALLLRLLSRTRNGSNTMNIHDPNIATPKVTTGPLPSSRKVYARPDAAPDLRVPVREIVLTEAAGEPPVPVYDTTGPYTDPDVTIDVEQGLARTRIEWVKERGGVEDYEGRPIQPVDNGNVSGKHLARNFPTTHRPLRRFPANR